MKTTTQVISGEEKKITLIDGKGTYNIPAGISSTSIANFFGAVNVDAYAKIAYTETLTETQPSTKYVARRDTCIRRTAQIGKWASVPTEYHKTGEHNGLIAVNGFEEVTQ